MSRSPHSQRVLKNLLGQTPLQYVTEWRMQKAMRSYFTSEIKKAHRCQLGRSVTSPTLRSVRRSSELSGPALVSTSNVLLMATVRPEWSKLLEVEDSDCGGGARTMQSAFVCTRRLAFGNVRPRTQNQPEAAPRSSPGGRRASVPRSPSARPRAGALGGQGLWWTLLLRRGDWTKRRKSLSKRANKNAIATALA